MALYLVQHGIAAAKDADPERGLTKEGAAEVKRIAKVAAGYSVRVDRILHSGKKRAAQTAEIMAAQLKPPGGVARTDGLNPLDVVAEFAERIDSGENVMLVGHLPFMENLTAQLVMGHSEHRVFRFQNGGIVCLEPDPAEDHWIIRWALMPRIGEGTGA